MPGIAEILEDDQNKFADVIAGYPSSDIAAANDDRGATIDDNAKLPIDKTKPIAGPIRSKLTPIRFPAIAASYLNAVGTANGQILVGFSITETADGVADWLIHHGQDVLSSSPVIDRIKLIAGGSLRFWYGDDAMDIPNGVSLERISGTVDIILYIAHE